MMKRNALRIVCNPGTNRISYYFRNELGEWMILSGNSPLTRQFYTKTTIKERSKEIIEKIDEVYNRKNKGVDIYFEGNPNGFEILCKSIKEYLPDRDIACKQRTTQIAVVGKKKSGKSFLINGIEDFQQSKFKIKERTGYTEYIDNSNNVSWCEVGGLDLNTESIESALSTIRYIQRSDLSCLVYCVSGISGRMEESEKRLLMDFKNEFPGVTVITVVTMCYKDDARDICDEIERMVDHMETFPVLAKDYKTTSRSKKNKQSLIVKSFGIDVLHTYIFEGKKVHRIYHSKSICEENEVDRETHVNKTEANNHTISDSVAKDDTQEVNQNISSENSSDDDGVDSSYRKVNVVSKTDVGKTTLVDRETHVNKTETNNHTISDSVAKDDIQEANPNISSENSSDDDSVGSSYRKVIVVGKTAVGKTTLIEGIASCLGVVFKQCDGDGTYSVFEDEINKIQWYEVNGIDLGIKEIDQAFNTVTRLISENADSLVYCISAESGRVEDIEKELIRRIADKDIVTIIALTMCYKEDLHEMVKAVSDVSNKVSVMQVLAKTYHTGVKHPVTGQPLMVDAFGVNDLCERLEIEI